MDLTMQIASMSMSMSTMQTQQSADVALLKKAMNAQEAQAATLIESMPQPVSFGHRLDIRV